ncbi:pentatricopeptide repeat-containing protein DWY1, chloroplastic-like [Lycium ferocissimum]|uniref:pentatricopeptide repeat-containing protein DWY1, chloroplastic-like n=1 Tax=Lycium ferocissimum TaxID=112874 RepID=UPI002814D21D|nr:pentatricopeptide repeat-containing protein DWY1, chloroplastic-like [Lycium ferocissimum]
MDGHFKCGEIELFHEMPERDAFSWIVLIDGLSKSGRIEEAREKFEKLLRGHGEDTSQVLLYVKGKKETDAELENDSERLTIAFGLINVKPGTPIRIVKNLRVCNDLHTVTKLSSEIYESEIVVRDNSHFHHFKNGSYSCNDSW